MIGKSLSFLTYTLLFILPFIFFPFGISFFETPKIFFAEIIIALMFFLSIFRLKKLEFFKNTLTGFILIILSLSLVQLVLSKDFNLLIFGNVFRLQGTVLLWELLGFSVISSTLIFNKLNNRFALISLFALTTTAVTFGLNQAGRAMGTLGEPNALAASAIFFWPFIFFYFRKKNSKNIIAQVTAFLCILLILFLTKSRSGLLAFVIELVFVLSSQKFKLSIKKAITLCIILVSFSLFLPILESGKVLENRFEIWQTSGVAGFSSPIIGNGFGNAETAIRNASYGLTNNLRFEYVDSSHNILLDWWVEAGFIGFISFLYLIFQTFSNIINKNNFLLASILLGLLAVLSFNPSSIVTLVAFWWVIGQSFYKEMQ